MFRDRKNKATQAPARKPGLTPAPGGPRAAQAVLTCSPGRAQKLTAWKPHRWSTPDTDSSCLASSDHFWVGPLLPYMPWRQEARIQGLAEPPTRRDPGPAPNAPRYPAGPRLRGAGGWGVGGCLAESFPPFSLSPASALCATRPPPPPRGRWEELVPCPLQGGGSKPGANTWCSALGGLTVLKGPSETRPLLPLPPIWLLSAKASPPEKAIRWLSPVCPEHPPVPCVCNSPRLTSVPTSCPL